jgi:hypothetical protein
VKLIDIDNLVLIGPGSEWFWTAFSAIVVAITFFAIYRQVRMQRSAAAIEQLESIGRELASERMSRAILSMLLAIEAGTDPTKLPMGAVVIVGDFWDKVGYLTKMNHFDRKLVHRNLAFQAERAWARLQPTANAMRKMRPDVWADFEWLARTMSAMDAKLGVSRPLDAEALQAGVQLSIQQLQEELAAEEQMRTVPVRILEFSRANG